MLYNIVDWIEVECFHCFYQNILQLNYSLDPSCFFSFFFMIILFVSFSNFLAVDKQACRQWFRLNTIYGCLRNDLL